MLERFQQMFKNMLRSFCLDAEKDWDKGAPLLLLDICDAAQESTGFSPAGLLFGHSVQGPQKALQEQWLSPNTPSQDLLKYVSSVRERMSVVRALARTSLGASQVKLKAQFDKAVW